MKYIIISCWVTSIATLLLALLVYFQNRSTSLNRLFALHNISISFWCFSFYKMISSPTETEALLWSRTLHLGAFFIPVFFLHFILELIEGIKEKKKVVIISYLYCGILFMMLPSNLFISNVNINRVGFKYFLKPGVAYHLFSIYFFSAIVYGLYECYNGLKIYTGFKKNQIRYIFLACCVGYTGGATAFFPLFGISMPSWSLYSILVYTCIITYAIVKYRLLDMNLVIRDTTIHLISSFILAVPAITLIVLFPKIPIIVGIFILFAFILPVLYAPLKKFLKPVVEKAIFGDKYRYLESITQLGKKVINLDQLLDEIVRTLVDELALDDVSIYLYREETNNHYLAKDFDSDREKPNRFSVSSPSILFMNAKKKIIIWKEESFAPDSFKGMMISMLSGIGVAVSIPLVYEGKMIGLMNLSDKKTKETWTSGDLNLLSELSERIVWDLVEVQKYGEIEKLYKIRSRHERITSLAELGAGLCHQLNNPLTPIKGFLQLVGKEGHKIEDLGVLKGEAEKAVDRIVKIIKEVLTFSETGINIAHIESNVNAVLRKAVPMIVGARNFDPVLDLDENLPTILGDERALLDIFVAIGTNGIEAMFERRRDKNANARDLLKSGIPPEALVKMGILADVRDAADIMVQEEEKRENKLTIRTRWVTSRTSQVTSRGEAVPRPKRTTDYIRVEITDTGEGIKPEDLAKIFNPMHSTKSMHIGLSLAIAHRLVEAHGGYMDVKSKVGEGTSFFVNLPLAYNPSMKETTQNKEAQRSGQRAWEAVGA